MCALESQEARNAAVASPSTMQALASSSTISDIVRLAQPSHACASHEVTKVARYAAALKSYLIEACTRLLRSAQDQACLVWYSNDTTPMVTRQSLLNNIGHLVFRNRVRRSGEYVIQRMFVRTSAGESGVVLGGLASLHDARLHTACL